jgi:hypothetical protein
MSANQVSGYLQKKVDEARQCNIRDTLEKVRASQQCCMATSNKNDAGSNEGYLYKKMNEMPNVPLIKRGISNSSYLQQRVDQLNDWIRDNDRFADVDQRRPAAPCPPAPVVYHAGEPIPVPRFRCDLINNMSHE